MGSFLVFLATGFYWINFHKLNSTDIPWINIIVYFIILLVGCYYFYFEACTEIDEDMQNKLTNASRLEWIIRALNQILLLSLWFILEKSLLLFCYSFGALFITFIVWDLITYKYLKDIRIFFPDVLGFIASIVFLIANLPLDEIQKNSKNILYSMQYKNFLVGFSICPFIVMVYLGLSITKFKPFEKKYWKRPLIH